MSSADDGTNHRNELLSLGSHWHVWKTIQNLQAAERLHDYQSLTIDIVPILRLWAEAWTGIPSWQSFLNKKSFQHEIEESMVALFHLNEWRRKSGCKRFVAVDVCGGKGVFSMLLKYMAGIHWNHDGAATLDHIILLEKSTEEQIGWNHLRAQPGNDIQLVTVDLWSDCNLHAHDSLLDRFHALSLPLALTGIHLCKGLSPAMLSLVNLLGEQCQYFCLAPCCMPRVVTSKGIYVSQRRLQVFQYESQFQREGRRLQLKQRAAARRKGLEAVNCIICESAEHWVGHCPLFPSAPAEQTCLLQEAASQIPCWNCGKVGHFKSDCPNEKAATCDPPVTELNVCAVIKESDPLPLYCRLLLTAVQGPIESTQVVVTGLSNETKHQTGNWNSLRKAVYIVACR